MKNIIIRNNFLQHTRINFFMKINIVRREYKERIDYDQFLPLLGSCHAI